MRRITRPLAALVEATREIDRGETNVQVAVQGQDEIATLAVSFNQMVARQEDYTRRLEEQAQELERAHTQTRAACQVVREISALQTLEDARILQLDQPVRAAGTGAHHGHRAIVRMAEGPERRQGRCDAAVFRDGVQDVGGSAESGASRAVGPEGTLVSSSASWDLTNRTRTTVPGGPTVDERTLLGRISPTHTASPSILHSSSPPTLSSPAQLPGRGPDRR